MLLAVMNELYEKEYRHRITNTKDIMINMRFLRIRHLHITVLSRLCVSPREASAASEAVG